MNPRIVFVHLNNRIPLYLRFNLLSTLNKFPHCDVVLIHNQKKNFFLPKSIIQYSYTKTRIAQDIENLLTHPKDFRENFWFAAIVRFDAMLSFMNESNGPLIHVESDVILSSDFPISSFTETEYSIAYPVVADNRGVASTVFLRDLATATDLVEFSLSAVNENPMTTDMEILAKYRHESKFQFKYLPFAPSGKLNYLKHDAVLNQSNRVSIDGIIDGNDIGVYLFGSDPRNTKGASFLGRNILGNYANPKNWKYVYNKERRFLSILESGIETPVYSIHATCKNKLLFLSFSRSLVIRLFIRRRENNIERIFYPGVFITLGIQKLIKIMKIQKSVS